MTGIVCLDDPRTAPLVDRLAVRPAWQGQGLGRRLFLRLLAGTAKRRAWLVAHDLDSPARALSRSLGWHEAERVVLAAELRPG